MSTYTIVGPPGCEPDWGVNYRPKGNPKAKEKRAEVGAVVSDLPPTFAAYLLAEGKIKETDHG